MNTEQSILEPAAGTDDLVGQDALDLREEGLEMHRLLGPGPGEPALRPHHRGKGSMRVKVSGNL